MPRIKSVNLPYRGVISSSELQSYFNSILADIESLETRIAHVEAVLTHGYVYGCRLEYDQQSRILTVGDGFYTYNGELRFITEMSLALDLKDGDIVYIDPTQQTPIVRQDQVVPEGCIPLGQYVNRTFSYQVRNQLQAVDVTTKQTRFIVQDVYEGQAGKHLDIQYSLQRLNMQMFSQADAQWHYIARPELVFSQRYASNTSVNLAGLELFSQSYVFGGFQPKAVIFTYITTQAPSNVKVAVTVDNQTASEETLTVAEQPVTLLLPIEAAAGYRTLQVKFLRINEAQDSTIPAGFACSVYISY